MDARTIPQPYIRGNERFLPDWKRLVATNDLACRQSQPALIIFGVLELRMLSNQQL